MSTIKVDTYLTRGGASEIAIDKLKGASSAGSMTVVGEGGSTTTNLQQGLCKAWSHFTGGYSAADSFNITSLTDNGTGQPEFNFTNNMGNATYSAAGHSYNIMIGGHDATGDLSASSAAMSVIDSSGNFSDIGSGQVAGVNYFGDLA